jgi:hypothetical protein
VGWIRLAASWHVKLLQCGMDSTCRLMACQTLAVWDGFDLPPHVMPNSCSVGWIRLSASWHVKLLQCGMDSTFRLMACQTLAVWDGFDLPPHVMSNSCSEGWIRLAASIATLLHHLVFTASFLPNLARKKPPPNSEEESFARFGKKRTVPWTLPSATSLLFARGK